MTTFSPLSLLGALGALSLVAAQAVAAVDTSEWKCESCPYDKTGVSGAVDVGAAVVSDDAARFGDTTGLQRKGLHLVAGGNARWVGDNGWYGNAAASDLGLDIRALQGEVGREGQFNLRLGYAEIPHRISDSTRSPFLGLGGDVLTLPAGYPAASTASMPLATTLQDVDLGSKRSRFDIAAAWTAGDNWTHRVRVRHEVRDGTQRIAGSFFSTSSQLVAPLDQTTDQIEVSTAFTSRRWQASLAYNLSQFRNDHDALTWANPFTPVVTGATRGQLALAPGNQFQQVNGSLGFQVNPWLRASGDFAVGRMTQDEAYLAATLNSDLVKANPGVLALPRASLNGQVDTFNGSLRLSANPGSGLRVNAAYIRDVRDNRTSSAAYPALSTDMFLGAVPRSNQPYGYKQDRFKLNADYRATAGIKASVGVDQDNRERSYQEVVTTRETTVWARVSGRVRPNLGVELKLAHAERSNSPYGTATWIDPAENPLLRKFNLANRTRESGGLRADLTVFDGLSLGLTADIANDDYSKSLIGLTASRTAAVGADVAYAISDEIQLHAYAQAERLRSEQAGSQAYAAADWSGRTEDRVKLVGVGVRQTALKGKLELNADLVLTRSHSLVDVTTGATNPPFPTAITALDSLKLQAVYKLQDKLSLLGTLWHQHYESRDWHADGVLPGTVPNLLSLGELPPQYRVNVLQLALRYQF